MSDGAEHVEHVIAQGAEPPAAAEAAQAAQVAVATAEAAASLAHATAAAAELEAAGEIAEAEAEITHIEEEADAWRTHTETQLSEFGRGLAQLSESVERINSERLVSVEGLHERLTALEQLNQPPPAPEPSTPATSSESQPESDTIAGTEAAIVAGPAEVSGEISLAPSSESQAESAPAPRKKHRWI